MEDVLAADKIANDLKLFTSKKYKPVGLHHLKSDIDKFVGLNHIIDLSHIQFSKKYISNQPKWVKNNKIAEKIAKSINMNTALKKDNIFSQNLNSVIVYSIPIPKSIFFCDLKTINEYFKYIESQKKDIDYFIIKALEKYGYWGLSEKNAENLVGTLDINKLFTESNLGIISKEGYPITAKNGPRIVISYVLTNAPLKLEKDEPIEVKTEYKELKNYQASYLKFYFKTYGILNGLKDTAKNLLNSSFGDYIAFCQQCEMGKQMEINLLVTNPLDYKEE